MNHEIEKLMIEREELDKKICQLDHDIRSGKIASFDAPYVRNQFEYMINHSKILSIRIRIKSERIESPLMTF